MSDSEPIPPNRSVVTPPPIGDGGSMSETKHRTVIEDTKSRSGSQPESKEASAQTKPDVVEVGTKLGPYELVRKLGQGGMGAVYEARHTKLNKTFALKVLPPGFASNAAAVTRFEREMRAIGQLDHPHIIKATDAGEWNGTHILVMEYVEGTDLSVLVKTRGPLSVRDACKAIRQAALGLQHAHEHGLVHRDIKPSNLFVTKSGQIKLLDLGLARLGDDGEQQRGLTTVGQILGTPDYMAPEQWDDTHSVDARADLYSLGCTLCFVLTGRAPYADVTKSSLLQLMKAHVEGAIPNLTHIRLDVPPELNAIFVRLLAKQAEDRYPNAAEVIAALEPFTRKGADGSTLTSKPVFAPGKEPPTAHATPSTSAGQAGRDSERSAQRSIKSLSAFSTDDAFASDRPLIHGDSSASLAQTIIQPRATKRLDRRWPLIIGLSGLALALLIGFAISNRPKGDAAPAGQSSNSKEKSAVLQTTTEVVSAKPTEKPRPVWDGWPKDAPEPAVAPFDAAQAKQHQEAWAKHLGVPVEYTNTIDMKFILIPPGEFMMGSTPAEIEEALKVAGGDEYWKEHIRSEAPQHNVIHTQPIYLGIHEVTQGHYEQMMGKNPSHFAAVGAGKDAVTGLDTTSHPVEKMSWNDAAEFCAKLSQQEKLKPFHFLANETVTPLEGTGYHLPTEAQWEFACRAGTTTRYWIGDKDEALTRAGWFNVNSGGRTHAVGELMANPFGLYDTHGNVWEWVQDWWEPTYYGQFAGHPSLDPNGPSNAGSRPVIRGGAWDHYASSCRASYRSAGATSDRYYSFGFRLALTLDAVKAAIAKTPGNGATTVTTP